MAGSLIKNNLQTIQQNILKSCQRSNRKSSEVKIIAVSKKQPLEVIEEAMALSLLDFGENYTQELLQKKLKLPQTIKWHFIGHLQTNKAKDVVGNVEYIHSVDSLKLLEEINKRAQQKNLVQKILIQINFAKEETKSGLYEEDLPQFLENLKNFKNVLACGIMLMPPLYIESEEVRPLYAKAKKLLSEIQKQNNWPDFKELSFGTSSDYAIAIEEGATMIRLGSILLGERSKN